MYVKLQPYVDPTLLSQVLQVVLVARQLDVAASPYDVYTTYQIPPIPIETHQGRLQYQQQQTQLFHQSQPIRQKVLSSYNIFLSLVGPFLEDGVLVDSYQRLPTTHDERVGRRS